MTTYGEGGPVFFRIAHQNIAEHISYKCDQWVLRHLGPTAQKEARLSMAMEDLVRTRNPELRSATLKYAVP